MREQNVEKTTRDEQSDQDEKQSLAKRIWCWFWRTGFVALGTLAGHFLIHV